MVDELPDPETETYHIVQQEKTVTTYWYRGEEFSTLAEARKAYVKHYITSEIESDLPEMHKEIILDFFEEHLEEIEALMRSLD